MSAPRRSARDVEDLAGEDGVRVGELVLVRREEARPDGGVAVGLARETREGVAPAHGVVGTGPGQADVAAAPEQQAQRGPRSARRVRRGGPHSGGIDDSLLTTANPYPLRTYIQAACLRSVRVAPDRRALRRPGTVAVTPLVVFCAMRAHWPGYALLLHSVAASAGVRVDQGRSAA